MTTYSNIRYAAAGVTEYATADDLPTTAASGSQAFVTGSNRLYLWNGTGWYNIALINTNPSISGVSSSYDLAIDGTPTTVTIVASDPEGIPITYSLASDTSGSTATVVQGTGASTNVFTITPSTSDANAGTFTLTFRASDGVNLASAPAEFSLEFSVVNSNYTSALITSVGADNAVNNSFIDSSTNSHTITVSGDAHQTTFSPYRHGGYSTYFDGTGDYVTAPSNAAFDFGTGDFTVETWVYYNAMPSGNGYPNSAWILGGGPANSNTGFDIAIGSTNVQVGLVTFASLNINAAHGMSAGKWYHLAVVRNGNTLTCYKDGSSLATADVTGVTANAMPTGIAIAAAEPSGSTSGNPNGYYSDVRVVKGTAVYTTDFTPPTDPLTAITNTSLLTCHLPYIVDGSTNEHAITVAGNTSTQPFSPYDYSPYSSAVNGGSLKFDGTGDYVTAPSNASFGLGTGDFTIEWWAYQTATASYAQVFAVGTGAGGIGAHMRNNGDITVSRPGTAIDHTFTANLSSSGSTWYHIALVRNGSTLTCFVNGTSVGTATNSTNYAASHLNIGIDGNNSSSPFTGIISDFRIVKGTAVYTADFTPPTAPLTAITGTSLLLKGTNAGIIDKSQSVSTITLNGDVSSSTTHTKYLSSSMYFDGTGDYITLSDSDAREFGGEDFTIELWVKTTIATQYATLLSRTPTPFSSGMWSIMMNTTASGGQVAVYVGDYSTGASLITTSGASIRDDSWHHVAVVRNGSSFVCYIDGTSRGTGSWAGSIANIAGDIRIGADQNYGRNWQGYMSDIRLTKGLARYTSAFTPPTAALKG